MGNSSSRGRSKPRQEDQQTIMKWSVDGFSSLLDKGEGWTYSRLFEIMGHNWYLKLNPKDKRIDDMEYVSLMLQLDNSSVKPDTVVDASFKLLIYDQSYGKHSEHQVRHIFQTASTSSGASCMISLEKLKERPSKFIDDNNSCTFGVEFIKVTTSKVNTMSETLFVQKPSIFNEAKTYTWCIEDDFSALKNSGQSPDFEVGGYKWYVLISTSCDDGNHISLDLCMKRTDDLPNDSANLVELSLSIKGQKTGNHWKRTGRCQFTNNAHCWGWTKFISLEDFKNSSKGYLVKNKCYIEAEVAIVGSSKMKQCVPYPCLYDARV